MPSREQVLSARAAMLSTVAASKRGDATYDEARAACEEYKRLADARQMALFGKLKVRIQVTHLLR